MNSWHVGRQSDSGKSRRAQDQITRNCIAQGFEVRATPVAEPHNANRWNRAKILTDPARAMSSFAEAGSRK